MQLNIAEHVRYRPHATRLRRRVDRRLRPIRPSRANELWYRSRLVDLIGHVTSECRIVLPRELRGSWPHVMDVAPVDRAIKTVASRLGGLKELAQRWADQAARKSLGAVDDRLAREVDRSLGIDLSNVILGTHGSRVGEELRRFQAWNTQLITSVPEELLGDIGAAVNAAWTGGQRIESLADAIAEAGDVAESRAASIARDQTAKMNAGFNRVRQGDLGIEYYVWLTSDDERVRETHARLHGVKVAWAEPGPCPGTIDGAPCHAGEDILCRCDAQPVIDIDALEQEAAAA